MRHVLQRCLPHAPHACYRYNAACKPPACTLHPQDVDYDRDGMLDFKELYIAILRLYDLLNQKLPCHLKIPSTTEMQRMMTE